MDLPIVYCVPRDAPPTTPATCVACPSLAREERVVTDEDGVSYRVALCERCAKEFDEDPT